MDRKGRITLGMNLRLKPESLEKMKKSQLESKKRASKRHNFKLKKRLQNETLISRHYKNQNAIILSNGQGKRHNYAKFVVGYYLNSKGYDFISEFPFEEGISDIYCSQLGWAFELESNLSKSKYDKKVKKYDKYIFDGILNEVWIISLDDFSFNFEEDIKLLDGRLGL